MLYITKTMLSSISENYNISHIGKTGALKTFTLDYCQHKMDNDIDNNENTFIQLAKVLQNVRGKNIATLEGILEGNESIAIKVQYSAEAKKEYEFTNLLKDHDGFIQYKCYFTCNANKEYFERYALQDATNIKVCSSKGSNMGIIVMPLYSLGSFEAFLKDKRKHKEKGKYIRVILIKVINNYFKAFRKLHFLHGDFFAKNILLETYEDPIIIDFEKSTIDNSKDTLMFWRDIQDLLSEVSMYVGFQGGSPMYDLIRKHCGMNLAYNKMPTRDLINEMVVDLKNLVIPE